MKPLETPRPWLHCARCDARTPFVSSDKFRVNAQKKRLDAWLVYRCAHCDQNWNFPVLERCPVDAVEPTLLLALTENDEVLAWRYAFDVTRLSRYSLKIESSAGLSVEKRILAPREDGPARAEIMISAPYLCGVRLDRLLAAEIGVSRTKIDHLAKTGALVVMPSATRGLSQPARDGQRIEIDLSAIDMPLDVLYASIGG
ncbi:MAG: DUF1062 domain-containing protein [Pseudomonadota bacterium]